MKSMELTPGAPGSSMTWRLGRAAATVVLEVVWMVAVWLVVIALVVLGVVATGSAAGASAGDPPTSVGGGQTSNGGEVHLGQDGSGSGSGQAGGGGVSPVVCVLRAIPAGGDPSQLGLGEIVTSVVLGSSYWRICTDRTTGAEVSATLVTAEEVDPRAAAEAAARQARSQLGLVAPTAFTNPPDGRVVVNVPTWLWVGGPSTRTSPPATLGGVTATVTAVTSRVEWDAGSGPTVICGTGTAYDPSRPARSQHTDCAMDIGGPTGSRRIVARQVWHLTYAASNGITGDLGDESFSTGVAIEVTPLTTVIREATG